ncbi:divergent polysaccharide deacetylase family protein [bacterium]|nr:divergent polysaccharide deacetylase family protein [bacterium]
MGKRKVKKIKKKKSKKKGVYKKNLLRIFVLSIIFAIILILISPIKINKDEKHLKKLQVKKYYIPKTKKQPKTDIDYFHATLIINGNLRKYFNKSHLTRDNILELNSEKKIDDNKRFLYTTFNIKLPIHFDLNKTKDDIIKIIEERGGHTKDSYSYNLNGKNFITFYVTSYDRVTHFFSISKSSENKIMGNEPVIAIIIDDCGYLSPKYFKYLEGRENIDLSILPYTPYAKEMVAFASKNNNEVMLHLPLEAFNKAQNKDKGMILTNFDKKKQSDIFKKDLSFVPTATGFNNHKGSKGTSDKETMENILSKAQKLGLFFLDSRTSAKSIGYETAVSKGIPAIKRDVFLDNQETESYIINQFHNLFKIAYLRGYAVGICHMRKGTVTTFNKVFDEINALNIRVVPVSYIIANREHLIKNGHKTLPKNLKNMLENIEED